MRKIYILAAAAGILSLNSCKEKGPAINFGTAPKAVDTTYTANVEAKQKRVVVVEEFTGATCANCPQARDLLTNIASQYPDQVNVMELHINNFKQSEPATGHGGKYDLRTVDGTTISTTFYNTINQMPSGGVNRVPVQGDPLLLKTMWATAIADQIAVAPVANVTVSSTFDASSKVATVKVKVAYTEAVSRKQYLTLAILEDDIVDVQEFPDPRGFEEYTFRHTLRDVITAVEGDEILKDVTTKEAGRVYERTFVYEMNSEWKPEKCKFVAFLHNNEAESKEILQGAETKLQE